MNPVQTSCQNLAQSAPTTDDFAAKVASHLAVEANRLVNLIPDDVAELRDKVEHYRQSKREIVVRAKVAIENERSNLKDQYERRSRKADTIKADGKFDHNSINNDIRRLHELLKNKETELLGALAAREKTRNLEVQALLKLNDSEIEHSNSVIEEIQNNEAADLAAADRFIAAAEVFFSDLSQKVTKLEVAK